MGELTLLVPKSERFNQRSAVEVELFKAGQFAEQTSHREL
jgi:hypothetical protein